MPDQQPDEARVAFSIADLALLTVQFNADPAIAEADWRQMFRQRYGLTAEQSAALDDLPDHIVEGLQKAFGLAAQATRNGSKATLRVVKDYSQNRRELQLMVPADQLLAQEETVSPESTNLTWPIVCCCADCSHWHWCGSSNPCV